ncbi:hypothetical protein ACFL3S_08455 [Gemmatimonadota bacterium]
MRSASDMQHCLEGELAWAFEGSAAKWGEPYLLWSAVPDWSEFRLIQFKSRDSVAVCAECEVFFEDTLDQVEQEDWIQTLDPRYVAFRLIDRGTGVRKSIVLIREDQVLSDRDLYALPQMVRCDNDVVHLRARAAGITFTGGKSVREGPRVRSERKKEAPATVSGRRSHQAGHRMAPGAEVA